MKACNPETGTATCTTSPLADTGLEKYTYDANGNLLTRTDARGIVTTLVGYDALNRPSTKTYTKADGSAEGTPSVTWGHDLGRRGVLSSVTTSTAEGVFGTSYTYDSFGRIGTSTQVTANKPYTFTYGYSLTDRLSDIEYPSGRKISYGADAGGRITSVRDGAKQVNYALLDYTAANGIPKMTMGNGIVEQTSWNDRFQMTELAAGTAGSADALSLRFYPCTGLAVSCATGNDGNVRTQTITGGGLSLTQTYTYDSAGRLSGASESGTGPWNEACKYTDSLERDIGNRWIDTSLRFGLPD